MDYHAGYVAYKNLTSPEMYVNNELCAKWNINKDYWVSYNAVHPVIIVTPSGSTTLTLSASFLIAILLIELALLI